MLNTDAFSKSQLQDCYSLLVLMESKGTGTISEAREILKEILKPSQVVSTYINDPPRICPECGLVMRLYNREMLDIYICTNGKKGKSHKGCQYSEVKK